MLTDSEFNYSQLDREALAIIFEGSHFYNFLIGQCFHLVTDNEPLTRIFHPKKPLPQVTSTPRTYLVSIMQSRLKKVREIRTPIVSPARQYVLP